LRMRPDYLIVGEIRGEEAYVLFQAVNTGHSGMSTMHAESFEAAVNRLMSPPMNIPPAYIPAMSIFVMIKRVKIGGRLTRRVTEIGEVYMDDSGKIRFNTVFKWNPRNDTHESYVSNSVLVRQISDMTGKDVDEVLMEIGTRSKIVSWMVENGIFNFEDVSTYVQTYYTNPDKVLNQVMGKVGEIETTTQV